MGRKTKNGITVIDHASAQPNETHRKLVRAGTGAALGGVMGATVGGSMGVAAFGGAIAATGPLAIIGGLLGAGAVGLWSLFFGDRKRLQFFQRELEVLYSENRTLRQRVHSLSQDALDASSEIDRLTSELLAQRKDAVDTCHLTSGGSTKSNEGIWVGTTENGAVVVFDPDCQLSDGKYALFFLPSVPCYRVFEKSFMRGRLTKVDDAKLASISDAYAQWLAHPSNRDIQKIGIAQLVKRSGVRPTKTTAWGAPPPPADSATT